MTLDELIKETLELDSKRKFGLLNYERDNLVDSAPLLAKACEKMKEALEHIVGGDPTEHAVREWYSTATHALADVDALLKGEK